MALREAVANGFHTLGNMISGESQIAVPVPADNYIPVNEPGATRRIEKGTWYRAVNERGEDVGMLWFCRCGQINFWPFGKYDIRRKLESVHYCSARCASVIYEEPKPGELPQMRQIVHTEKDDHGNVLAVGARYSLLDMLPDQGKKMDERERNKRYATLSTWRIGRPNPSLPYQEVFNRDYETEFVGHNAKILNKAAKDNNPDVFGLM